MIETANEWLAEYQLLLISVLIPVIAAIVAALSSFYATRRTLKEARVDRGFQSTLKLADFRQNWINELREELSIFVSMTALYGREKEPDREAMIRIATKLNLLMNPKDKDYDRLSEAMSLQIKNAFSQTPIRDERFEIVSIGQGILKREWDRLKNDLSLAQVRTE